QEMIKRVRDSGKWFSWLLWQEFRFAGGDGNKRLRNTDTIVGWLLIICLAAWGWVSLQKREWIWLGVGVYCAFLCLNWPNPNPRYLVPLLPFILWGITEGIKTIFAWFGKLQWGTKLVTVMLLSIALGNGALLAVDVMVARSGDFYSKYEAGIDASLISCVKYL